MTDVVYGRHPVLEALAAGEPLEELLVAEGSGTVGPVGQAVARARAAGIHVHHVPRAALDRAAGGANHQGVVAVLAGFRYADLAEVLARALRAGEPPLLVVLDSVQDVHNLGSLVRTAEAAGAHGVLLSDRGAAGVTGAVRKASAGATSHVPIARLALPPALDELRSRGLAVVGLDEDAEAEHTAVDLSGPLALVVGGEGQGLSTAVRRRCEPLVRLPMRGRVASLNAAVAGSIVLYEALRQRGAGPSAPPSF